MKKSLLALAILASFAGAASAQSSVTVYGLVDGGITRETGGAAGDITKVATGVQSGNRLGFKGSEDLGSGLKANFQLESGFDLDTGASRQGALFGRQAWVGLSGNFGAAALGRQYGLIFQAMDSIDPFGTGLTGATTNLMNPGNVRVNNSITYSTPNMSGFAVNTLYAVKEIPGNSNAGREASISGTYSNGPLALVVAYDRVAGIPASVPAPFTASGNLKLLLTGATYNFGPVIGHAGFETEKSDGNFDYRDFLVGATVPVGPGSFIASYIKKDDRLNTNKDGKQFAVGYLYSLSKRTNVYTTYSRISNGDAATWTVGDASSGGSAPSAGNNSTGFTVGLRHKF